jgi:CspA family cold shock protein
MIQVKTKQAEAVQADILKCRVKWFNLHKGYGFLRLEDDDANGQDIFMHFSLLEEAGFSHVCEGDEVICEVGKGKEGLQVTKVHEVNALSGNPTKLSLKLEEKSGIVKWFNVVKGYGFIEPDDGTRDIFLHAAPLKKLGIDRLNRGRRVRAKILATDQGAEVRELFFLDDDHEEELTA